MEIDTHQGFVLENNRQNSVGFVDHPMNHF